jgi:hypothetical protein
VCGRQLGRVWGEILSQLCRNPAFHECLLAVGLMYQTNVLKLGFVVGRNCQKATSIFKLGSDVRYDDIIYSV